MKKFLLIGLTALLLLSCEESNIDENKNYIGFWTSIDGDITYTLDVQANGRCNYKASIRSGNKLTYSGFEGKFALQDSTLKIGFKTLTINEPPALLDGTWYLTMDKHEYTRK